jgi:hypothetical protein
MMMLPRVRGEAEPGHLQDPGRHEPEFDTQLTTIPLTTNVRLTIQHPLTFISRFEVSGSTSHTHRLSCYSEYL